MNRIALTNLNQLQDIVRESKHKPVLIFKHSTRCGISRGVFSKFEKKIDSEAENMMYYYLDLLNFRDISNEISKMFGVHHQSPQLLVIKEGKSIADFSHYDIISLFNFKEYI
ncbi:bacillithiol system redox-active protein YtxJ [Lutibacter sp. B1]|uniref:bacillithiol system redox-active protein YtxJ n=1 Tax=Lutibacter sp. B1 TaxID=2725996 RepID=UPI001456503C|nr:bacillithiol system redox-active protein YtxJ [Lutibacter sp. B1]NLP59059.1 bacillithiol system redox-active protein YtxJ [Lutibacter sp. B1]